MNKQTERHGWMEPRQETRPRHGRGRRAAARLLCVVSVLGAVNAMSPIAADAATGTYPAPHDSGTCNGGNIVFRDGNGNVLLPTGMTLDYSIMGYDRYPQNGERQRVWVRTHVSKWEPNRGWVYQASNAWWWGDAYDFTEPLYWYDQSGRPMGDSSARQGFTVGAHGYYQASVEFRWERNQYGAPAGSVNLWQDDYCTF